MKLRFNGYKARTPVLTTKNPEWKVQFLLPCLVPAIGGVCLVEVRSSWNTSMRPGRSPLLPSTSLNCC